MIEMLIERCALSSPQNHIARESDGVVYIWYYSLVISTGLGIIFLSPRGVSPFLAWVIFTRARVSLALLSLRKNGDYS